MKRLIFLAILCTTVVKMSTCFGQVQSNDLILLHGVVLDATTKKSVSNVHYLINSISSGVTNEEGKFSLYMQKSDSVKFTYLGYTDFLLTLSDTLKGKSFVAAVFLKGDTLNVGEVVVLPRMSDLRSEFRTTEVDESNELLNAKNNLVAATYQGLTTNPAMGDPITNYQLIQRKQVITASELGGIPSDQMLGLNVFTIIPAAIYLIKNGLPEKPAPPKPHVSPLEIRKMIDEYERNKKKE